MRFIHIADIHASRERLPQTLYILNTLTERCKQGDIDFIVFAGDFWDSTITATKGSGFSDIISAIRELEKYTFLFFIYGTPTHEPSGSLAGFVSEKTKVIDSMQNVIKPILTGNGYETVKIVCIPEPRRSNYVGGSISETDKRINDDIKAFIKESSKSDEDKYTIVVYHGEVKGAVYQNGVSASSPTAISRELLQSLNADYYALGHIHMPQEVFPNAWYPGSACPKNFGEIHDGHYNLVNIENGKTEVEQVSFGLPTFVNYDVVFPDFARIVADFTNKNVKIRFDCTKEERKALNIKQLIDDIKERTHALSIKIEPNIIESDVVPISEVSKRKSLVEKMTEYAKEKELVIPKHAKELLQNIQDSTLAKLAYPQHSFELLSLSLRGAIGIRDGQHKEDFELNFENMEDGIVCLAGPSGHGKSTLLENCHPYPCMLTRSGTLKEHFYLKDSHRILIYKDENNLYYRISILIDGKTASGKAAYFAETSKDKISWKSIPDVDGSLDAYKEWVNSTFGSIDVFLRTAFFAKEPTKEAADISVTTKSERMELLSKLAGTDHLKEVSVAAKELRKEIEKSADKIETEIESYSHYEDTIKQNEQDITSWNKTLKTQNEIVASLEKKVSELKIKDTEYQKSKAVTEANNALKKQYKKSYDDIEANLVIFNELVNNMSEYDKIDECNKTLAKNAPLIKEKTSYIEDNEKKLDSLRNNLMNLNIDLSNKKVEIEKVNSAIELCESQIVKITGVCPTCGKPMDAHKINELQAHIDKSKKELKELEQTKNKLNSEFDDMNCNYKRNETEKKEVEGNIAEASSILADLQSESYSCSKHLECVNRIYFDYSREEAVKEHKKLTEELKDLQSKLINIAEEPVVEDVSSKLKETEEELRREFNYLSDITASIKAAEKENERYRKELESVTDKKKELKTLQEKITAYNFIEDAFSNNGIPAIELRESAPEIADITNRILKESLGSKFEIRFGSTSELKTNRKVNEDFNILVYDSENDDEKTIDLISSGEKIWIKQALFYAFSIVQMNRTGFNFRTRLIDESDGSLDGASRPKYMQMVTSAHKYANARVTLLISHSQEIKDIAPQIIEI